MARTLILGRLAALLILSCDSPRILTLRGNSCLRRGKDEEAAALYTAALEQLSGGEKSGPKTRLFEACLQYNLGTAYFLLGEMESALKQWDLVPRTHAGKTGYVRDYNEGIALYGRGEYRKAEEMFRRALAFNPEDIDAKANLEIAARDGKAAAEKQKPTAAEPGRPELSENQTDNILDRIHTLSKTRKENPTEKDRENALGDW